MTAGMNWDEKTFPPKPAHPPHDEYDPSCPICNPDGDDLSTETIDMVARRVAAEAEARQYRALRDEIAIVAMQSILNGMLNNRVKSSTNNNIALQAYDMAEAMLAVRAKLR